MLRLLRRCGRGVTLLALLSVVVAGLQFVVPLYMMAIYNRILQTYSLETLQLITLIAGVLLVALGVAEMTRSRILALMARRVGEYLNNDVYNGVLAGPGSELAKAMEDKGATDTEGRAARTQALTDLRQVSAFMSSGALNTFFDAMLSPIFIGALFILDTLLGFIGVGAGMVIFCIAICVELLARRANRKIGEKEGQAQGRLERSLDQHDAIASMGMAGPLYLHWERDRAEAMELSQSNQSLIGILSGLAKAIRLVVQMGVLGVGAYLVITTSSFLPGAIIAASIILGRALAPIDQSISLWRTFMQARGGAKRLMGLMDAVDSQPDRMDGPPPSPELALRRVTISFPAHPQPLIQGMEMTLQGGDALGVFGPNGAGKTTLLRAMAGLHHPVRGSILLSGTPTEGISDNTRHQHLGYLPQDVQLLPGSIADNIARFRFNPLDPQSAEAVFAAAAQAGAAPMIQSLPEGYGTPLKPGVFSAGQTQLLGLARAVHGDPLLLLLDEPAANLDVTSKGRVAELIGARRASGQITVFITHDQELLRSASHLLVVAPGKSSFGPADEIIRSFTSAQQARQEQSTPKLEVNTNE